MSDIEPTLDGDDVEVVRYQYMAYPTPRQIKMLNRVFGACRVLHNDYIALQKRTYEQTGKFVSTTTAMSALITLAKRTPGRAWLAESPNVCLQQAVRNADKALRTFLGSKSGKVKGARRGFPRFKKRTKAGAAVFTRNYVRVRRTSERMGRVWLTGYLGEIPFEFHRDLPGEVSSATIMRRPDGKYVVSFVTRRVKAASPKTESRSPRVAGIDLGLTPFAAIVYSDGTREKVEHPRYLKSRLRKLARAQRALSRCEKGSANHEKARLLVAREHTKVRDARSDFHRQLAARLTSENDVAVVEALNVVGLSRAGAKNAQGRGLRRAIADAGWSMFITTLTEHGQRRGCEVVQVDPRNTSRTCSDCGVTDEKKDLGVREWTCPSCGAALDRDWNAAVNILLASGHGETLRGVERRLLAGSATQAVAHNNIAA